MLIAIVMNVNLHEVHDISTFNLMSGTNPCPSKRPILKNMNYMHPYLAHYTRIHHLQNNDVQ